MRKEPAKSGDEQDWVTGWRHLTCVHHNNTGIGKKIKRALNKRSRRRAKEEIKKQLRSA